MIVTTVAYTNKGGRVNNEDCYSYNYNGETGVWIVADGLGGHPGGDIASKLVSECVSELVKGISDRFTDEIIIGIMNDANSKLVAEQNRLKITNGLRTTAVAAFVDCGTFRSVHFGDSRLYYFRNNKILFQSKDHSMSQLAVDMGEIEPDEIRFHEDRNRVLKVLGDSRLPRLKLPLFDTVMESGDAFMLCTDGFWELVLEEEMKEDIKVSQTPEIWLERMLLRIERRMSEHSDNYTAVCCYVR